MFYMEYYSRGICTADIQRLLLQSVLTEDVLKYLYVQLHKAAHKPSRSWRLYLILNQETAFLFYGLER